MVMEVINIAPAYDLAYSYKPAHSTTRGPVTTPVTCISQAKAHPPMSPKPSAITKNPAS